MTNPKFVFIRVHNVHKYHFLSHDELFYMLIVGVIGTVLVSSSKILLQQLLTYIVTGHCTLY